MDTDNLIDTAIAKENGEEVVEEVPAEGESTAEKPEEQDVVDKAADETESDAPEESADEEVDIQAAVDDAKLKVEDLPPINQYVYEKLPEITTTGTIAGKDVTIKVKTANEIPDGFEWKSKREEKLFDQALIDQGVKANTLAGQYQGEQNQQVLQQEYNDIQSDLTDLQTEGLIPKFSPETAQTNPDNPGVKIANEVLKIYQETNQKYAEAKKAYRISYRDAFEKYEARQTKTNADESKAKNVAGRKEVAAKVGAGKTGEGANRLPIAPGVTVDDILASHENDWD